MINPAIRLIVLLCSVKKPIIVLLHCAETTANKSKGSDIPMPKNIKLNKLVIKSNVDVLIANKTTNEAGLQGRIIAPKKKPKINELKKGFLAVGDFI